METTGDHEVKYQEESVLETQDNPFPDAADLEDSPAPDGVKRRLASAHQERAGDPGFVQTLSHNAGTEGLDIYHNIRKLGHRHRLCQTRPTTCDGSFRGCARHRLSY